MSARLMIGLFGRSEESLAGVATLLHLEHIPYVRLSDLGACGDCLPVAVGAELSAAESASLMARPSVVLNGGIEFAAHAGAAFASLRTGSCSIGLDAPIWPDRVRDEARRAGQAALRVPRAPLCSVDLAADAWLAPLHSVDGHVERPLPAIVQADRCVWSTIDLGAAFAMLLNESYRSPVIGARRSRWARRFTSGAYYAMPEFARRRIRTRIYAGLDRRLRESGEPHSSYPVDATGWLLIELVKALICRARGWLVRLAHWPSPFAAAAVVTHDIEPRRYAYTTGLRRLLARADRTGERSAFGLVAKPSRRHLSGTSIERLRRHEIFCHGLDHRGEEVRSRMETAAELRIARDQLEGTLRRRVVGYRSPRLDRSSALAWALDRTGFRCDSSFPDVDRENLEHFGAGVCLTLPYRPLISDGASIRPSRCLELPLTAPDCIQPLFTGATLGALRAAVAAKARFVRGTGGLYVVLTHAGVFGDADALLREQHLAHVLSQLRHPDVWLTTVSNVVDWWCGREALTVAVTGSRVTVGNPRRETMAGVRIVLEYPNGEVMRTLPALPPRSQLDVDFGNLSHEHDSGRHAHHA